MIEKIRKQIIQEEFDYQTLIDCLRDYSCPRDKISDLLRKKVIIRVKKGLYIFGDDYRHKPYSRELLANLIYGPSYISLEYALSYYSLIPERVETVTSVTSKHAKKFSTPIGIFSYRPIPVKVFSIGLDRIEIDEGRSFLIAVPEKALADKICQDRGSGIRSQRELYDYITNNLRIDLSILQKLRIDLLDEIAAGCRSRKIKLLSGLISRIRRKGNNHA